jgi:hypothetical protein
VFVVVDEPYMVVVVMVNYIENIVVIVIDIHRENVSYDTIERSVDKPDLVVVGKTEFVVNNNIVEVQQ